MRTGGLRVSVRREGPVEARHLAVCGYNQRVFERVEIDRPKEGAVINDRIQRRFGEKKVEPSRGGSVR